MSYQKERYEAMEVEFVEVETEDVICASPFETEDGEESPF